MAHKHAPVESSEQRARREASPPPTDAYFAKIVARGTVKWWKPDKGYGAISSERTGVWDIWCHLSAIERTGSEFRTLRVGEDVEVEFCRMDQQTFKYRAHRVRSYHGE